MIKYVDFQCMGIFYCYVCQLMQRCWCVVIFYDNVIQQVGRSMICVYFVDLGFECFYVFVYVYFSIFFDIVNYVMNF